MGSDLLAQCQAWLAEGDFNKIIEALDGLEHINLNEPEMVKVLAQAYYGRGLENQDAADTSTALSLIISLMPIYKDDPDYFILTGNMYFENNIFSDALYCYGNAMTLMYPKRSEDLIHRYVLAQQCFNTVFSYPLKGLIEKSWDILVEHQWEVFEDITKKDADSNSLQRAIDTVHKGLKFPTEFMIGPNPEHDKVVVQFSTSRYPYTLLLYQSFLAAKPKNELEDWEFVISRRRTNSYNFQTNIGTFSCKDIKVWYEELESKKHPKFNLMIYCHAMVPFLKDPRRGAQLKEMLLQLVIFALGESVYMTHISNLYYVDAPYQGDPAHRYLLATPLDINARSRKLRALNKVKKDDHEREMAVFADDIEDHDTISAKKDGSKKEAAVDVASAVAAIADDSSKSRSKKNNAAKKKSKGSASASADSASSAAPASDDDMDSVGVIAQEESAAVACEVADDDMAPPAAHDKVGASEVAAISEDSLKDVLSLSELYDHFAEMGLKLDLSLDEIMDRLLITYRYPERKADTFTDKNILRTDIFFGSTMMRSLVDDYDAERCLSCSQMVATGLIPCFVYIPLENFDRANLGQEIKDIREALEAHLNKAHPDKGIYSIGQATGFKATYLDLVSTDFHLTRRSLIAFAKKHGIKGMQLQIFSFLARPIHMDDKQTNAEMDMVCGEAKINKDYL